ncbi:oligosaccharide repeat unit polymerase [Shewanella alkalitolerans]|uniref:oligosaccharide repeat unit polymerase n=1 Tax=Shewanella alkalitolerans TaxID=2864209 RepID=UPI001C655938|nr:oligosaccharide repeat unit polymerase [Shewanella alkalitolerans]QYJ98959.1 oligosaccharide repeat unit polymerase [Shewanella alkalitolerans]
MKISLFFIGIVWLFSIVGNIYFELGYKPLSLITVSVFFYVPFVLLILSFLLPSKRVILSKNSVPSIKLKRLVDFSYIFCLIFIFFVVVKSDVLKLSFYDYFLLRRGGEVDGGGSITGYGFIDTMLTLIIYPILVSLTLIQIAFVSVTDQVEKSRFLLLILLMLSYTYVLQVNYPIFFFILVIFFFIINNVGVKGTIVNRNVLKVFSFFFILLFLILASAVNRYGSFDLVGILFYYPATYFTIGPSIFDINLNNPQSLLHDSTYGINLLGQLLLPLKYLFSIVGFESDYFTPASIQNVTYLNEKINISESGIKNVNAFGTVLFSWYRDFGLFGVFISPIAYGLCVWYLSTRVDIFSIACFYLLLCNGIMGLTVSPLDQAHFTLVFIILFILSWRFKWKSLGC